MPLGCVKAEQVSNRERRGQTRHRFQDSDQLRANVGVTVGFSKQLDQLFVIHEAWELSDLEFNFRRDHPQLLNSPRLYISEVITFS
ncbi:hypothetical protein D3C80_495360 [compost metagenome]